MRVVTSSPELLQQLRELDDTPVRQALTATVLFRATGQLKASSPHQARDHRSRR